jgi:type II pantothenate kinase
MPIFHLIANPEQYYPCRQDMLKDKQFRDYWLDHFIQHFELTTRLAIDVYGTDAAARAAACHADLRKEMESLRDHPHAHGELNLQVLGIIRQQCLIRHGIADPYQHIKTRENSRCATMFAPLVQELDRMEDPQSVLETLILGVFAGNIFDLGATATAAAYANNGPAFLQVRNDIRRPWLVDHFNDFARWYFTHPPGKAAIFVDNAGSDIILGIFPLARWLAQRGTRIVLVANDEPALNDITVSELRCLTADLAEREPILKQLVSRSLLTIAGSGGGTPLIDLRHVSDECNAACAGADLLILEGMGRSLESNFDTAFIPACVKLCMIKEPIIARRMGGKVFDVIFRFDAPS